MIWLIIYLIGVASVIILGLWNIKTEEGQVTIGDLITILVISIFSWGPSLVYLTVCLEELIDRLKLKFWNKKLF